MTGQDEDPLRRACDELAAYLPRLARLTPEPGSPASAVPGRSGRAATAPVPGNAQALYAYTAIWASARWAEEILLYAAGAHRRQPRGGSDANTVRALAKVIPRLAAGADDDTWRLVMAELDRRLAEVLAVPAVGEAESYRPLPRAAGGCYPRCCPYCGCYDLKAVVGLDGRPTGRVECHVAACWRECERDHGWYPVATMGTDEHGRPGLAWPDRFVAAPELDEAQA